MVSTIHGLDAVTIHVRDVEKARTFYRDVLGLQEVQHVPQRGAVFAIPGIPTVLNMHIKQPQEQGREPGTVTGLVFSVLDITAACEGIRGAGGRITDEPEKATNPTGSYMRATIADPDGNEFLIRMRLPG
jgi:catechol 2,3-dioxygenase-like lactoylglutathione lyase family enzyme